MDTLTILDTAGFIDHFRGLAAATAYIQRLSVTQRATTDVTVIELYKGAVNREQLTTIVRFLERNHVTRIPVSAAASQRAVTLLHDYVLAHSLGIPDALIAAIAVLRHAPPSASNSAARTPDSPPLSRRMNGDAGCATSSNVRYGASRTGFGTGIVLTTAIPVFAVTTCVTPSSA